MKNPPHGHLTHLGHNFDEFHPTKTFEDDIVPFSIQSITNSKIIAKTGNSKSSKPSIA
jgi:hypothetical protein